MAAIYWMSVHLVWVSVVCIWVGLVRGSPQRDPNFEICRDWTHICLTVTGGAHKNILHTTYMLIIPNYTCQVLLANTSQKLEPLGSGIPIYLISPLKWDTVRIHNPHDTCLPTQLRRKCLFGVRTRDPVRLWYHVKFY